MKSRLIAVCATIVCATLVCQADGTIPASEDPVSSEVVAMDRQSPTPAADPYLGGVELSTSAPERASCKLYTSQCKDVGYYCGPAPGRCICAPGPPLTCAGAGPW